MPIKNYTTSISEEKTVTEIMSMLAAKKASHIQISYDEKGRPSGVSFIVLIKSDSNDAVGTPVPFKLPCNFDGVYRALLNEYKDRSARNRFERNPESRNQARRVAWRIIKDWVAAQMALIEADQATLAQVFLPYVMVSNPQGQQVTLYDKFMTNVGSMLALPE